MESRESSTGTKQKLTGPWAQRTPGAVWLLFQLHLWHLVPCTALLSSQEPEPTVASA